MEMINVLEKLDFSFWQITILIIILIFRNEFKQKLSELKSISKDGADFDNSKEDFIEILEELKSSVSNGISNDELEKKINLIIHDKYIGALIDIKNKTTHLWMELSKNFDDYQLLKVPMRPSTFLEIENDLRLLRSAKLLNYSDEDYINQKNKNIRYFFLDIQIIASKELSKFVSEAKKF